MHKKAGVYGLILAKQMYQLRCVFFQGGGVVNKYKKFKLFGVKVEKLTEKFP